MQKKASLMSARTRGIGLAVSAVSMILCIAVVMVTIINGYMVVPVIFSVLAVCSHLLLWWLVTRKTTADEG